MTLTRANVETELVRRAGAFLTAAGLATTTAGANADLASPIAFALRQAGITPADPVDPANADFADISDVDALFDLAELRLLENIYQNYTKVDVAAGAVSAKNDQLRQAIKERIDVLRARVGGSYGGGLSWSSVSVTYGSTTEDEFSRPLDYWP